MHVIFLLNEHSSSQVDASTLLHLVEDMNTTRGGRYRYESVKAP